MKFWRHEVLAPESDLVLASLNVPGHEKVIAAIAAAGLRELRVSSSNDPVCQYAERSIRAKKQ